MSATAEIWEIQNGQIIDKHNLWEVMEKIGTVCHKAAESVIAKASGNLAITMVMTDNGWKRA